MDRNTENMNDFESLLKARLSKKPVALYASSESQTKPHNTSKIGKVCSAKEVLLSVSKQLRAIQNADTASRNRIGNKLDRYKSRTLMPVNMLPMYEEVPKNKASKFETQCVSDTQLINVIENAEIVDKHGGVTQEFDETFCQKSDDDDCDKLNEDRLKPNMVNNDVDVREHTPVDKCQDMIEHKNLKDNDSKLFDSVVITSEMDTITCHSNDMITDCEEQDKVNTSQDNQELNECDSIHDQAEDDNRPNSPILNPNKRTITPPLVVSLYTFEEFEDLAHPIIEEHEDLNMAKNLINSQIIGRELFIPDHVYGQSHRESPVLNKIECITSNFNKDDLEKIDAGSIKCIDRDKKDKIEPITLESSTKSQSSSSCSDNMTAISKFIKAEIKDEILFSSDEENEYFHKEVQELPLTCALETSFYDRSDVLDKTMYVGFQTASNKSIQINTVSFTKAKSILSGIDVEESGTTLKDLVEIFDSGKDVHEPILNMELPSTKQELNTQNKSFSMSKPDDNNLTSENIIECHDEIGNTFKNISLTALERDGDINDDIVMSQIIECKIIPKSAKANKSIQLEDKMSDTLSNINLTALEENKEHDDVVMSQVIEFKSIARTPKPVEKLHKENVIDVFKNPNDVISKRKLDGFKTASNKKIKLSDKALARCKKVFHDIDLDDAEDGHYIDSNKDFNICSSEVNSGTKSATKNIKNEDSVNLSKLSHLAGTKVVSKINKYTYKTDVDLEKNEALEKLDLQINDQALLQEFEDNEMPFDETNNNAYVGFRTASNKGIAVSDDAMAKTKSIFHDVMTINAENKSDNDNSDQIIVNKPTIDLKSATDEQTKITNENIIEEKKELGLNINHLHTRDTSDFVGFKTAANKEIRISEQARAKAKQLYKDIDKEVEVDFNRDDKKYSDNEKKYVSNAQDEFNCGIDTQDFLAADMTHIEDLVMGNSIENKKSANPTFQGFQTASKKSVLLSKEALEKGKKLLKDIANKECNLLEIKDILTGDNNADIKRPDSNHATVDLGSDDNELQFNDFVANTEKEMLKLKNETPIFKGFQTASNKKITISHKAMEATKKMFHDLELFNPKTNDVHDEITTVSGLEMFSDQTASGSGHEKQNLNDLRIAEFGRDSSNAHTANRSEKAANKSERTLEKSLQSKKLTNRSYFKDMAVDDYLLSGFQTASAKPIHISADSIKKTNKMVNEFELDEDNIENNGQIADSKRISSFAGFQIASNKEVKISAEALARSKQIMKDIGDGDDFNKIVNNDLTNKPNGPVNNIVGIKANDKKNNSNAAINFSGLQTASNKKVTISNEALARSKKFFEDDYIPQKESNISNEKQEKSPVFKGFQTASNKKVNISEKALEQSKKLFHDIGSNDCFKDKKPEEIRTFQGFQTASNKKIKVSEKALAKCKQLFEDINLSQLDKDSKATTVLSDNLEADLNEDVMCLKKPLINVKDNFQGFQTASNKKVTISEKALAKSKEIFDVATTDYPINDKHDTDRLMFKGFQTASNKKVKISEQALAKSKQLFGDINLSQIDKEPEINRDDLLMAKVDVSKKTDTLDNENSFKGFQTANNKKVKVSQQALAKSRDIFRDIQEYKDIKIVEDVINNKSGISSSNVEFKPIESTEISNNAKDVIDTQILNDFQDSLNTEDFCKSTPKSKRSGSPILSCPRAKKRKFETPYRTNKKIETKSSFVPPKVSKTYPFNDDYKKHKKYNLKDIEKLEKEYDKVDIDPIIAEFNFDSLLNFEFDNERNDYTNTKINIEQLKKIFIDSVNKKIVPDGWLENHLKLILWKLLSYEVKFPNVMKNICTVNNVLEQLKYRYDKELYNVERPILRKVMENDEVASKTMVLCVAGIYADNVRVGSVPITNNTTQNVELLLTDGWYCVKATLDRLLIRQVAKGVIVVGTKLAISGAELINCEQGIAPWEDTSSVRLKLSGNSVSLARWSARLGPRAAAVRRPLCCMRADGGKVHATRARVVRVYPRLFVERVGDGSTVTRSERLEHICQMKYESERQALMEKLYEEVEKEMSDQDSQDSEGCSNERNCLESGSQISKCMKKSKDPDEYRSHLTKSQSRMLEDHNSKQREKLIERVRQKLQKKLEESGLKERNVVALLKVRLAGLPEDGADVAKAYLSIWKPSDAVLELVTEGAWIEILNVIPTGIRNSEIQLSAGRQTVFNPYKHSETTYNDTLKRKCYEIKEIAQNPALTTDHNEIDTVGIIFSIEPSTKDFKEKENFQNVYLADADKNILCVNFWGGLKKFGFENVLDTGQIVTCVNLQKRSGNTRRSIPEYRATEFSYFTKTPKDKKALEITKELSNKLSKIKEKFCEDCVLLKSNYSALRLRNYENVSPYNFNHNHNLSKNIVSPFKNDVNLNLTGLDFESSFDHVSPQAILRKKRVNEKIEKIRLNYGEPPPLSSMHIINKSKNASATYKSPLVSNLERSNVTETSTETPVANAVSLNRTYVKNINPVKLNFSNNANDDVDHFAEDFEASPPLSLDSDTVN